MARTPVTSVSPNPMPSAGVSVSNQLAAVFVAADASQGNQFLATGRDLLVAYNSDLGNAATITILSAADTFGRKADVTAYTIPAGGFIDVLFTAGSLFTQADGNVYLTASANTVKLLVLSL